MSAATPPTFSIVTPCLNRAGRIGCAIDSVLAQRHPGVEHIVIDGRSNDGTLEVLARYPHLRVVSEPDRNLYDAINKGLLLARGDVIGLLNSDDVYAPGAFAAASQLLADPAVEMVIGGAEMFTSVDGRERVFRRRRSARHRARGGERHRQCHADERVLLAARTAGADRSVRRRFPLAADKDFWMRMVLARPAHRQLSQVFYRYRSHGGSLTFSGANIRDTASRHLLELAQTRFGECRPGTCEHAAYRRWHAWAVGYRTVQLTARRRPRGALQTAAKGLRIDPAWPLRFLARLPGHWRDRDVRSGPATDGLG